ncbi:8275_t:CDS:2, partial [Scutellospora calospora]
RSSMRSRLQGRTKQLCDEGRAFNDEATSRDTEIAEELARLDRTLESACWNDHSRADHEPDTHPPYRLADKEAAPSCIHHPRQSMSSRHKLVLPYSQKSPTTTATVRAPKQPATAVKAAAPLITSSHHIVASA